MPVTITVKSDGVLEAISAKLSDAPAWLPDIYEIHMPLLGHAVEEVMVTLLEPHRYTGALQDSVTSDYDGGRKEVAIYPTAQRGAWDGGTILELGTRPHTPPFGPIAAWAEFRGLPAFPIWWGIVEHGTQAHPFLQRTLDDYRTQTAMDGTAGRIATDAALEIVQVGGATQASIQIDTAPLP